MDQLIARGHGGADVSILGIDAAEQRRRFGFLLDALEFGTPPHGGIALGFELPLRISGDIKGTLGCMLMGPAGFFEMSEGVIRALRHVHMHPDDAAFYGVKAGDFMRLKVGGPCAVTFDRLFVRVDPEFKLEVHIDTDEGNACALAADTPVELLK